jgi:hypothetical protein
VGEISAVNIGAVPGTVCHAYDERHATVNLQSKSLTAFRNACATAHVDTCFGAVRDLLAA